MDINQLILAYPSVDRIEDAAQFLAAYANAVSSSEVPKHTQESCTQLLARVYGNLHQLVKNAHSAKTLAGLKNVVTLHGITQALCELQENQLLHRKARGDELRDLWTPRWESTDETVRAHIAHLHILSRPKRVPGIILHDLGKMHSEASWKERLNNIFSHGTNTFLVNASGTGKTRLLFEGLCLHWGLYFTAAADGSSLGSEAVDRMLDCEFYRHSAFSRSLPSPMVPDFQERQRSNLRIAHSRFNEMLLAYLIVFKLFLEAASQNGGITSQHRQRWLEAQLHPDLFGQRDLFGYLQSVLQESRYETHSIDQAISTVLAQVVALYDFNAAGEKFFIVLDEANTFSRFSRAFVDEKGHYSLLKEVLRTWRDRLSPLPVAFVVAGTSIPRNDFDDEEWKGFRWCSDTGVFESVDAQWEYASKFLPPHLTSSTAGDTLRLRMGRWLRGRHRFTAAYLAVLLEHSFQSPHCLLNEVVNSFTGYRPQDSNHLVAVEERRESSVYLKLPLEDLNDPHNRQVMHYAIARASCALKGPVNLPASHSWLVTSGYGYYADKWMSSISVTEPLILVPVAKWFRERPASFVDLDYFTTSVMSDSDPTHTASLLALALAFIFDSPWKASDLFSFIKRPHTWANISLSIISCQKMNNKVTETTLKYQNEGNPEKLVTYAPSREAFKSWLRHEQGTPFCIHALTATTTILAFILQNPRRGTRFWVFLNVLPDEISGMSGPIVDLIQSVVNSLDPSNVPETDEGPLSEDDVTPLLKKLTKAIPGVGSSRLLRVVAPLRGTISSQDITLSNTPLTAFLNNKQLRAGLKRLSPDAVLAKCVTAITEGDAVLAVAAGSQTPEESSPLRKKRKTVDEAASPVASRRILRTSSTDPTLPLSLPKPDSEPRRLTRSMARKLKGK